jgi:hypothetical protein
MSEEIRKLVVVLTPHDLGDGPGGCFALCEAELIPGSGGFVRPALEDIVTTKSLDDVLTYLDESRFLVLRPDSLAEGINRWLRLIGGVEVAAERAEFLDAWGQESGFELPDGFPLLPDDPEDLRGHPRFLLGRVFTAMNGWLSKDRADDAMQARIDALYVKDARWEKGRAERKALEARVVESRKRNGDEELDITELLSENATPRLGRATTDDAKKRVLGLEAEIKKQVFGQDHAVAAVCEQLLMASAGLQRLNRPLGGFLFAGPTGVGKTELARQTAMQLGVPLLRLDMSEYYDRHSISGLVGSTSGYKDSHRGGILTNHLIQHPGSVILFDEIEKGHPAVIQLLLQILDAARITDGRGTVVDCSGALILMTTNLGARGMAKKSSIGFGNSDTADAEPEEILESIKATLLPELRNRLDKILVFGRLDPTRMPSFVGKALDVLRAQLFMTGTALEVSGSAAAWLARHGYDADSGARPLERLVDVQIRRPAARLMLAGDAMGEALAVDCGADGLVVTPKPAPIPHLSRKKTAHLAAAFGKARSAEAILAREHSASSPLAIERKRKATFASPVRAVVITPADIAAIVGGILDKKMAPGNDFICVDFTQASDNFFATRPSSEEIVVTCDGETIRRFVADKAILVYDKASLDAINTEMEGRGDEPIPAEFFELLSIRARDIGEGSLENVFALGFQGGTGLDIPNLPGRMPEPWLIADWFLEIYNFVLGVEEQKRLFEL